ncbi:protein of unknown function [bacterium A37T11]|nr:protein of unknown function [bacterium A37T11]
MTGRLSNSIRLVAIAALLAGCASKKLPLPRQQAIGVLEGKERSAAMASILQNRVYYQTFAGKAKAKVQVNDDAYDATLNIRIERGKAIWISITAVLGIEAARILITPDSLLMVNRLQKEFVRQPYEFIRRFSGGEVSFASLEELLTGQSLSGLLTREAILSKNKAGIAVEGLINGLTGKLQTNPQYRIQNTSIHSRDSVQGLEAAYSNYALFNGQYFPRLLNLKIHTGQLDLQTAVDYNRIACDETLQMPFSIPPNYKEME